jgi:hypothetical protein
MSSGLVMPKDIKIWSKIHARNKRSSLFCLGDKKVIYNCIHTCIGRWKTLFSFVAEGKAKKSAVLVNGKLIHSISTQEVTTGTYL